MLPRLHRLRECWRLETRYTIPRRTGIESQGLGDAPALAVPPATPPACFMGMACPVFEHSCPGASGRVRRLYWSQLASNQAVRWYVPGPVARGLLWDCKAIGGVPGSRRRRKDQRPSGRACSAEEWAW